MEKMISESLVYNGLYEDDDGTTKHGVLLEGNLYLLHRHEPNQDPSYPKERPFYCCLCKKDTNGYSTCHECGHMKGRWKIDKHHCTSPEDTKKGVTKEFHKLLAHSKELGFH